MSDLRDIVGLDRAVKERINHRAGPLGYHADPPVVFRSVAESRDRAVPSIPVTIPARC